MLSRPGRDRILSRLTELSGTIKSRYGVKRIGLFGSHVHDSGTEKSDIDLLVEFDRISFDNYMDLKMFLEEDLDADVDLVIADSIKPRLRQYILTEVRYAAGY